MRIRAGVAFYLGMLLLAVASPQWLTEIPTGLREPVQSLIILVSFYIGGWGAYIWGEENEKNKIISKLAKGDKELWEKLKKECDL